MPRGPDSEGLGWVWGFSLLTGALGGAGGAGEAYCAGKSWSGAVVHLTSFLAAGIIDGNLSVSERGSLLVSSTAQGLFGRDCRNSLWLLSTHWPPQIFCILFFLQSWSETEGQGRYCLEYGCLFVFQVSNTQLKITSEDRHMTPQISQLLKT